MFLSGEATNRKDCLAICTSVMGDAPFCSFCFHDSAISVVDGHISGITDHITCFCFRQARNCCTHASPSCRCGITTTVGTGVFQNLIYKMRTINTICQGIASPYVWITDKLICICYDRTTGCSTAAYRTGTAC